MTAEHSPIGSAPLRRRLALLLKVVGVYLLVGPPVGALVFFLSIALVGMGQKVDLAGLGWIGLFALFYGVPFSYLIGIGPAAVAGLVVGVRNAFFGPANWLFAGVTGLGVGIGLLIMSGQQIVPLTVRDTASPVSNAVMIVTCFVSTMICWRIVRDWDAHQP
jgi:hypothetical protein